MIRPAGQKRAPIRGALFAFGLWVVCCCPALVQAADCLPFAPDEWAVIKHVHDGDTVNLVDGRKVRLIGINTPELGRDGLPAEPLAIEARDALRRLLPEQSQVALRFGPEQQDKYGRYLAHLYTAERQSVQVELLQQGLAAAVAVTPNVANLDCYVAAEKRAIGKGIWQQPLFRGIETTRLANGARGFHVLIGRVERVGESRKSIWLNFEGGLAARIDKRDLAYFVVDPKQWQGHRLRIRGWLYGYQGKPQLKLQHGRLVELLD